MLHGRSGRMNYKKFWKNKRVFITGHTGFKGVWLNLFLNELGAKTYGYSLKPNTNPSFYNILSNYFSFQGQFSDINNLSTLKSAINKFKPDIIFHLAAQPLVRKSYKLPMDTLNTNILGTANILEALREQNSCRSFVNITTDKCYLNFDLKKPFKEKDPLGGFDPYSASKASSEIITQAYYHSFFKSKKKIGIATARAGNIIGGGDWSEDRLLPDLIKSYLKKKTMYIRNPNATRPWQFILDPLWGYLVLAQELYSKPKKISGAWNFGPNSFSIKSVNWIVENFNIYMNNSIKCRVKQEHKYYESTYLTLNSNKSKKLLKWKTNVSLKESLKKISDWYLAYFNKKNMYDLSCKQISDFLRENLSK